MIEPGGEKVNSSLLARASLVVAGAIVLSVPSLADTSDSAPPSATHSQGRLVIRGSGNDVRIERDTAPPVPRRQFVNSSTILDAVVRMNKSGVAEPLLITYLKTHSREVPKVISQEDLERLHRAGVGDAVVAYLVRTTAVDIGVGGEGHPSPVYAAETGAYGPSPSFYTDDMGYSYPSNYPVYGSGYFPFLNPFLFFDHLRPHPVRPRPIPLGFGPPKTMGTPTMGMISRSPRRPGDGF